MADTNAPAGESVDAVDQIANLLGGVETESTTDPIEDEDTLEGAEIDGEGDEVEPSDVQTEEADGLSWSQALGVDDHQIILDDDGNLSGIQVKVDGETATVSVKDLIRGYQTDRHNTHKSQALAEEKRQFDALKTSAIEDYRSRLNVIERTQQTLEQALMRDFQSVDWDTLRQTNPGEYAAMLNDLQVRKGQIEQLKASVHQESAQLHQYAQANQAQAYQQHLGEQYAATMRANPQWEDTARMEKDMAEILGTVQSAYSLPPEALNGVTEAWQIEMLKDLASYHKGKTVAGKKLAAPTAKYVKGGKTSKPMSKATQLALNARKAKGAQQRDLQTDAIAALLMGR